MRRLRRTTGNLGAVVALLVPALTAGAQTRRDDAATRIDALMQRAADYGQFNGVALVADGGRIVYQRAFGEANMEWHVPNTMDARFEIASMTKAMTAVVIMQLVEEGKVRLDGVVSDYLPYYPQSEGKLITVDQLLAHTSGLQQDIAFPDDASHPPAVVSVINDDLIGLDSLVKLIAQRPLRFPPGTSYGYSSDAYAVLGAIIEHVTGRSYWDVLRERVLRPAGMTQTGVSVLRPLVDRRAYGYAQTFDGYENAPHIGVTPAGGLYSTAADLRRFDRALKGDALVREESKRRLFAVRSVITAYGWKTAAEQRPDGTTRTVLRTTGGLPGFSALLVRIPERDRTIILLSNTRDLEWRLDEFAVAIGRILDREPYAMPRRAVAEALAVALRRGATDSVLRARFEAMRRDTTGYAVSESAMNRLGYHLLNVRRSPATAVTVLALNAEAFPKSANVYDSLGEAYLVLGDTARAIANYRRSLALDPGNSNAAAVLTRLGAT